MRGAEESSGEEGKSRPVRGEESSGEGGRVVRWEGAEESSGEGGGRVVR